MSINNPSPYPKAKTRYLRVGYPNGLRLWCIHERSVWERLQREKVLYVDPSHPNFSHGYRQGYDWLRGQLNRRLNDFGGHYPWWALSFKPDLRSYYSRNFPSGTPCVRLELSIATERCLLSHEAAWCLVLGRNYVSYDSVDSDRWDSELIEAGVNEFKRPLPEPWQSRLVNSWERIFDLDGLRESGEWSDRIQANFEELRLNDVVAITEFVGRGRIDETVGKVGDHA